MLFAPTRSINRDKDEKWKAMRIAGVTIPDNKRIDIALTSIYGIGRSAVSKILETSGVELSKRAKELRGDEINRIRDSIEKNYKVEGELRREILLNIKRLKDIGAYRGTRHARGLPARGQRTRTNSRTRRGNVRKTMGSGKRRMEKK